MNTLLQYIKESQGKGTYIKLVPSLESREAISKIATSFNVPNQIIADELHTTIVFSRKWFDPGFSLNECSIDATINGYKLFPNDDGTACLVLTLFCAEVHTKHEYYKDIYKATFDYPDYTPHITLSYEVPLGYVLYQSIIDSFDIVTFEYEVVEELDLNWKDKVETL